MTTTEHMPRQVIEGKLLAALDDEEKVAVVLTNADLTLLIAVLWRPHLDAWGRMLPISEERRQMRVDLQTLQKAAFG